MKGGRLKPKSWSAGLSQQLSQGGSSFTAREVTGIKKMQKKTGKSLLEKTQLTEGNSGTQDMQHDARVLLLHKVVMIKGLSAKKSLQQGPPTLTRRGKAGTCTKPLPSDTAIPSQHPQPPASQYWKEQSSTDQ